MIRYIYLVTNLVNGKVYAGKHTNYRLVKRMLDPYYFCSSDNHDFWEDIRKYEGVGLDMDDKELKDYSDIHYMEYKNFKVELIQLCFSDIALNVMERMWIKYYRRILGRKNVYNIASGGYGGWDGYHEYAKENPEVYSEASRKGWSKIPKEVRSERQRKAAIKGNSNMTPEQKSARRRKQEENMTPEQKALRSKHISESVREALGNMTQEQRSERARRANASRTPEQRSEISFKREANKTPEQKKSIGKKISKSKYEKWIFHNPTTNEYRVHSLSWNIRNKIGFSERLCKLSDWDTYKSTHNLDVELNY